MEALKVSSPTDEQLIRQGFKLENITYRLNAEEITQLRLERDGLFEQIEEVKEEKKEAVKGFNEIIKSKSNRIKPLGRVIKTGYMEKEMLVMPTPNYDDGTMEYYNADGAMVYDRPLKPSERQTSILFTF